MFAGTVTPRKGVLELMKAAELLNRRDVLFLVVGNLDLDKEYARKVMEYAKCKGINAKFTGFVPYEDLKALYSACDVFVLPSHSKKGKGLSFRGYGIWKALDRLKGWRDSDADKRWMEWLFG